MRAGGLSVDAYITESLSNISVLLGEDYTALQISVLEKLEMTTALISLLSSPFLFPFLRIFSVFTLQQLYIRPMIGKPQVP